jgi:hypothetical protein
MIVHYFTNGYSDDNIDFYGKIKIGNANEATYALFLAPGETLTGEVYKLTIPHRRASARL